MTEFEPHEKPPDAQPGHGVWVSDELSGLSDQDLREYVTMWSERYDATRLVAGQGQRAWSMSKMVAAGRAEVRRRARSSPPASSS